LNTRPVWLITIAAGVFALVFVALNARLFFVANRTLGDDQSRREELQARFEILEQEVRSDVTSLARVPWRSLAARVDATNLILKEHGFSWLEMLDDIERIMPYDARLTRITPNVAPEGVHLAVEVVARTREAMLQLLDNLIADPRFDEPTPLSELTPEESVLGTYLLRLRVTYHPIEDPR
jgi:Tfp pilus assembly protein PilN